MRAGISTNAKSNTNYHKKKISKHANEDYATNREY